MSRQTLLCTALTLGVGLGAIAEGCRKSSTGDWLPPAQAQQLGPTEPGPGITSWHFRPDQFGWSDDTRMVLVPGVRSHHRFWFSQFWLDHVDRARIDRYIEVWETTDNELGPKTMLDHTEVWDLVCVPRVRAIAHSYDAQGKATFAAGITRYFSRQVYQCWPPFGDTPESDEHWRLLSKHEVGHTHGWGVFGSSDPHPSTCATCRGDDL